MSRLRRVLEASDDPIAHEADGYRLAPFVDSDVRDFVDGVTSARSDGMDADESLRRLSDTLGLWRGLPYEDAESHVFVPEQQRLTELRIEAAERLVRSAMAVGDLGPVHDHLRAVAADNPLREGIVALTMRVLYASGDQQGALRAFEEYRVRLLDEVGVEPTPELRVLQLQMLRQQISTVRSMTGPVAGAGSPALGWVVGSLVKPRAAPDPASDDTDGGDLDAEREALRRAEVSADLGHWQDAAAWFLDAMTIAAGRGDESTAIDHCLRLAHVVWDPGLGAEAAEYLRRFLARSPPAFAAARIRLCLAGGLYRSGYESALVDREWLIRSIEILEGSGDRPSLAWGLTHYRDALSGDLTPSEAVRLTERVHALGVDDPILRGQTDRARFVWLLRADQRARAGSALRAMSGTAGGSAANRFGVAVARNCWDLAMGRWSRVEPGLAALLDFKGRLGARAVDEVVLAQSFWLSRDRGDPEALLAHREGALMLAAEDPEVPHWQVAAALLAADGGAPDIAIAELMDLGKAFDLTSPPKGSHRLGLLGMVAEILAQARSVDEVVEPRFALGVLEALRSDDAEGVLFGWPAVFAGSKQRFMGLAAYSAGRIGEAERHLASAVVADRWTPPLRRRSLAAAATVAASRG